jgi:hypothetical protein
MTQIGLSVPRVQTKASFPPNEQIPLVQILLPDQNHDRYLGLEMGLKSMVANLVHFARRVVYSANTTYIVFVFSYCRLVASVMRQTVRCCIVA